MLPEPHQRQSAAAVGQQLDCHEGRRRRLVVGETVILLTRTGLRDGVLFNIPVL